MLDNFDKLDLEEILVPIGDNKVGENIKFTPEYISIKANISKKQIIYGDNEEKKTQIIDWGEIFTVSFDTILKKSKDLSVLFYLLISSIHVYSNKNFLDNMYIIGKFIDTFYKDFFPKKKSERRNFINWFFKKVILDLRSNGVIANNKINLDEYGNITFLSESCVYLKNIFEKYDLLSDDFVSFYDIVLFSINKTEEIKSTDKLCNNTFSYGNNYLNEKKFDEEILNLEISDINSAYDAINKIQKYIEKHQPRCVTPLLIDILNKFKNYETVDLIKEQEDDSPLKLIAKLINFI